MNCRPVLRRVARREMEGIWGERRSESFAFERSLLSSVCQFESWPARKSGTRPAREGLCCVGWSLDLPSCPSLAQEEAWLAVDRW